MADYKFEVDSNWQGSWNGNGKIQGDHLSSVVSMPKQMEGPGIGTNSEELLLSSAATCYLITYSYIAEKFKLPIADLSMKTEGHVKSDASGYSYQKIVHHLHITLMAGASEQQVQLSKTLTARAEKGCMVAKLMRGNVEVIIEPTATVLESVPN